MFSLRSIFFIGLMSLLSAALCAEQKEAPGCGEVNVFYTLVIEQGYPPEEADAAIRNSTIEMINAGYNVRVVLAGPEQNIEATRSLMADVKWDVTGVGYGMRGSNISEIITRFEDNLQLFREETDLSAPMVFNYNPWSFLWSVQRRVPLSSDCAGSPGKDLKVQRGVKYQQQDPSLGGIIMEDDVVKLAQATLQKVDALLGEIAALNEAYRDRRETATKLERRDMPVDLPGLNDLIASSRGLRNPLEKVVRARSTIGSPGLSCVEDEQQRDERDRKDMIILSSVGSHPGEQRWDAIKRCHGLVALRRQFPLGSSSKRLSPAVDAVVQNGAEWLKVSILNERKLIRQMAEEGWHPDDSEDESPAGSDDDDADEGNATSIVGITAQLVRAARLNRCRSAPPRVRIYLPNIVEGSSAEVDKLLGKVRRAGVAKGHQRPVEVIVDCADSAFARTPVPPLETAFANLFRNTQLDRLTPTLNLELTLLISLVSDITHGRIEVKPWYGTQVISHIKDEEHAPGTRLRDLYAAVGSRHLVCTKDVMTEFSNVIEDLGTPATKERAAILLGSTGEGGTVSSESSDELRSKFRELSVYPVPDGLQLPIRAVSAGDFDASRESVDAMIEAGKLPEVARHVFDKLDRQYHRSCYLYGWANGITTVSANSLTVQQIYAVINEYDDDGGGVGGAPAPDMFCAPLAIGLNTVRPCPEDRWNGLKDAKHGRRDAREKEAKAMKKSGAWGPALGVRSK
ncbi:hypothetical protein SLS62_000471 [Diatrype stigma]|uniref:Uncharacterized protein n=1 Tax=Diatrype stigma TaxID=117547 RepID=A0AAN9V1G2_9PEZI